MNERGLFFIYLDGKIGGKRMEWYQKTTEEVKKHFSLGEQGRSQAILLNTICACR